MVDAPQPTLIDRWMVEMGNPKTIIDWDSNLLAIRADTRRVLELLVWPHSDILHGL